MRPLCRAAAARLALAATIAASLAVAVTLAACGGGAAEAEQLQCEPVATSAGGDEAGQPDQDTPAAGGAQATEQTVEVEARRETRVCQGPSPIGESGPVRPRDPAPAEVAEVHARIGELRLDPGARFVPPVSPCDDVLVIVREGTLDASGTGIAPRAQPTTLYPGDAVRFGAEGDGEIVNRGPGVARTVVAYARAVGHGSAPEVPARPIGSQVAPRPTGTCPLAAASTDALVRPIRVASVATTPALSAAGGKLRVRILLDADGAGARYGGLSYLEGDPDLVVPAHTHDGAAELLFVEDGEGVMHVGSREVRIRPGAVVYVPERTVHDLRSTGTRPLRAIQVYSPSGPEQRFRGPAPAPAPAAAPVASQ